jgi:hypothetical protein
LRGSTRGRTGITTILDDDAPVALLIFACSQNGGESPRYANPCRGMSWLDAVLLLVCVAGVSVVRLRDGE